MLHWVEVQTALCSHYEHCAAIIDNYNLTSQFLFSLNCTKALKPETPRWQHRRCLLFFLTVYFILWGFQGIAAEMPDIRTSLYFCLQNRSYLSPYRQLPWQAHSGKITAKKNENSFQFLCWKSKICCKFTQPAQILMHCSSFIRLSCLCFQNLFPAVATLWSWMLFLKPTAAQRSWNMK